MSASKAGLISAARRQSRQGYSRTAPTVRNAGGLRGVGSQGDRQVTLPDLNDRHLAVLEALSEKPAAVSEIRSALGLTHNQVASALSALVRRGLVDRRPGEAWRIS